jgi:tetratricopeptide (TPR) repeat protein
LKQQQASGFFISRDSVEGNFLAGYYAAKNNDTEKASIFFDKLSAKYPDNNKFAETSLIMNLLVGNFDQSLKLASRKSGAMDYIILAIDDIKNKNFAQSLEILQELLNNSQDDASKLIVNLFIGWSYAIAGDYDHALKEIHKIIEIERENHTLSLFQEALILDLMADNISAEITYDKLLKINKTFISTSLAGNFYQRIGKIDKARSLYQDFNRYNPLLQIFTIQLDQLDQNTYNKQSLIATPVDGLLLFIAELNNVLLETKSNELAFIYARIIQFLDPKSPFTNLSLAGYYVASNKLSEALKYYQKIDKESFLYPNIETKIAQLYYNEGDIDNAERLFAEIIEKNKLNIESRFIYAGLLSNSKNYAKAIDIYTDILDLIKDHDTLGYVYYLRASNYYLLKKTLESERDLMKALELSPNNYTVMNDLAYSFVCEQKNLERAENMINKALASSPDNPQYLDTMGWLLYMKKDYEAAANYLEKAIEELKAQSKNNAIDATLYDHLGDIYWHLSKKNLARFSWQYALEAENDDDEKQKISKKISNGL